MVKHIFSELMKDKGVTKYRVSKETGISQTTLNDYENGKYELKIDKLEKLAEYFGVSVDVLRGFEENKKTATQEGDELSEAEVDLIMRYRSASEEMKAVMRKIAGIE